MIINNHFEDPYNKFAPEGSIPIISKSIVKSKLSNKFNQIMELAANFGNNENQREMQNSDQYINNPENSQNNDRDGQNYLNSKNVYIFVKSLLLSDWLLARRHIFLNLGNSKFKNIYY